MPHKQRQTPCGTALPFVACFPQNRTEGPPVIRRTLLALCMATATPALAQEIETPTAAIDLQRLLSVGFQVVSADVLPEGAGFVIFLQRASSLYVCELNSVGETKICIETQ